MRLHVNLLQANIYSSKQKKKVLVHSANVTDVNNKEFDVLILQVFLFNF